MKIDGKKIASVIIENLRRQVKELSSKNIIPHLKVVLLGSDVSSKVYVAQKVRFGEILGINVDVLTPDKNISKAEFINLIAGENKSKTVNSIIIQRPLPLNIDNTRLNLMVDPRKDVDGFHPQSEYDPPVALAVTEILKSVYHPRGDTGMHPPDLSFLNWLKSRKIVIIGRGVTAGKPIAEYYKKLSVNFTVAHSRTENLQWLLKNAEIIISCVGKPNIVRHNMLNGQAILIGVGLHQENKHLLPDYDQTKIGNSVLFYTPVPGGVGPVNVAMLMSNVVKSAELQNR